VYQSSAVPRIITRRCVPDVALNADSRTGVRVLVNDAMVVVGGTSAAAPLFAAFLARSRPGAFINPKLYSSPRESYQDIVHGDNGGYVAASGFDLVTGMGSINGVSLHAALAATAPLHFNEPVVELRVGSSATLTTTAAPSTSVITWTSSNAAILSIRDGGVLTAHAVGTARISATDAANSQRTVTRTIKALAPASASTPVSVIPTSIVVNTPTLTVMYGIANRVTVTATVLPVAAVDKRVRWQSSNPSLATVSSTGVVTGRKAGQVVITVTSVASPAVWKRVTVTVRSPAPRLYRMLFSTPQRNGKAV
jgi:subtilase family serine protease